MAITALSIIKSWFQTGKKPTEPQFSATWDSFWHKDEVIPQSAVSSLPATLNAKAEKAQFDAHKVAEDAHQALFDLKQSLSEKGQANGYVPLDALAKVAADYLNIVDDLVTGGSTALLSAEQGKVLKTQIDGINVILGSDNINLDTVQEIVDAIEAVQTSLSTILVNDLVTGGTTKALTAEQGKVLKGMVDGKISNIVTTVKTITSAVLATQDVAGFVTYINALSTVLVVANNETVEYQLSDTGRVFKILLNGRSFGTGQPAIVAANVLETTSWMNKDIRLSNYPSTRNDGQIPNNKVLSTDANGVLKMFSIATAPAPFIDELIPDSHLPSATGNIELIGEFFIPAMCLAANLNNANGIQITGQTINYATFVNSQKILMNVTTGAAEGSFAITCNNGLSTTKNDALLIVLGTVYSPTALDWENVSSNVDVSELGAIRIKTLGSYGSARWVKEIDYTKNFSIRFRVQKSPLGFPNANSQNGVSLRKVSDNAEELWNDIKNYNSVTVSNYRGSSVDAENWDHMVPNNGPNWTAWWVNTPSAVFEIKKVSGVTYIYYNNSLRATLSKTFSENMKLIFDVGNFDIVDIKYIELAI